ncbi:MAG: flagellar protein FlaG [Marinisporobacter sp.]|nr:flagellar protein FlaG [Marinisporobacter sp.]
MKIDGGMNVGNQYPSMGDHLGTNKNTGEVVHTTEAGQKKKESFPGEKQLIKAIESSNKDLKMHNKSLHFSIHEKTKQIMVQVIDDDTEEVVREIPSEKVLDMVAAMMEKIGLFVDKKA